MCNRVILLIWLLSALGHVWILEQPGSAKLGDMPRFQTFCRQICFVPQLSESVSVVAVACLVQFVIRSIYHCIYILHIYIYTYLSHGCWKSS